MRAIRSWPRRTWAGETWPYRHSSTSCSRAWPSLNRAAWRDTGCVVSDYGFCQDAIYAARNLWDADLDVYRRLAGSAEAMVRPPDLLVNLDGPEAVLLERIARRGRGYETTFSAEFLAGLREAYRRIAAEAACPVVTIDTAAVNLLDGQARQDVQRKILEDLREGR